MATIGSGGTALNETENGRGDVAQLRMHLTGMPDSDEAELYSLASRLRADLLELDVDDVRWSSAQDEPPQGVKGVALVTSGSLVVTAAAFLLRSVIRLADTWLKNQPVRTIKVELQGRTLELTGSTAAERELLIDAFLAGEAAAAQETVPSPGEF